MSANLIKSIRKSLGNEALEQRISELEARVKALEGGVDMQVPMTAALEKFLGLRAVEVPDLSQAVDAAIEARKFKPAPKQRKTRAKTYGTE